MASAPLTVKIIHIPRGGPIACNVAALQSVFRNHGYQDKPLNLLSIIGPARTGKSSFLNMFGGETAFRTAHTQDPCTSGVDMCTRLRKATDLGCRKAAEDTLVAIADAEGQGDHNCAYDLQLMAPLALVSKVLILNYQGNIGKDELLNVCRMCIELAKQLSDATRPFQLGHLHIRVTDYSLSSDEAEVFKYIMTEEVETPDSFLDAAATLRNEIRGQMRQRFASVNIWLFPAPETDEEQVTLSNAGADYQHKFAAMQAKVLEQLATPTVIAGMIMTCQRFVTLLPKATESTASFATILPRSLVFDVLQSEANQAVESARCELLHWVTDARREWEVSKTLQPPSVYTRLAMDTVKSLAAAHLSALDPAVRDDAEKSFRQFAENQLISPLNRELPLLIVQRLQRAQMDARNQVQQRMIAALDRSESTEAIRVAYDLLTAELSRKLLADWQVYANEIVPGMLAIDEVLAALGREWESSYQFAASIAESNERMVAVKKEVARLQAELAECQNQAEAGDAGARAKYEQLKKELAAVQDQAARDASSHSHATEEMKRQLEETKTALCAHDESMRRMREEHEAEMKRLLALPPKEEHHHHYSTSRSSCTVM